MSNISIFKIRQGKKTVIRGTREERRFRNHKGIRGMRIAR